MYKSFCLTLIVAICTACSTPSIDSNYKSPIGSCGGGLSAGVKAGLDAEYQKQNNKANIDASFEQYAKTVFDTNGASPEKYKAFLACVLEMQNKVDTNGQVNACHDMCKTSFQECKSDTKIEYEQCLRGGQSRCMSACSNVYNLDLTTCHDNCDISKEINISRWEVTGHCKVTSPQCSTNRDTCNEGCKVK